MSQRSHFLALKEVEARTEATLCPDASLGGPWPARVHLQLIICILYTMDRFFFFLTEAFFCPSILLRRPDKRGQGQGP